MAETNIRIVHLITTLDVGGAEMQLFGVLSHTERRLANQCVVSLTNIGEVGKCIQDLGVPVRFLGMKPGVPSLQAVWKLWRVLRAEKPDILHSWLYHADLLGLLGKILCVRKVVWNLRCSDVDMRQYRRLSGWVVHVLAGLSTVPDVVVVNSHAGKLVHEELGYHPRLWQVIPNGFDLDRYQPDSSAREWLRKELSLPDEAVVIGLVARFDPMKDHQTFLASARLLRVTYPKAHFVLCGRGVDPSNSMLMRWVKDYGLNRTVRLLGERPDIPRITAALDIGTSSSSFGEGFPNTVGEAMACGVPCVVTDVGDSARIVGDTGLVVPPKNPEALAKAWAELIDLRPEGRHFLAERARARIAEHFEVSKIAAQYQALYLSLATDWHRSRGLQ